MTYRIGQKVNFTWKSMQRDTQYVQNRAMGVIEAESQERLSLRILRVEPPLTLEHIGRVMVVPHGGVLGLATDDGEKHDGS